MLKLHAEATRLLTVYREHKDSDDALARRRAHVALDRFLMEHRELAAEYLARGLEADMRRKKPWYKLL